MSVATRGRAGLPSRSASASSPAQPRHRAGQRRRASASHTRPRLAVAHELGRAAAVAARDDGLRRGEGLDGDQPVVLLEGREDHGAARRQVRHERARRRRRRAASRALRGRAPRTSVPDARASSPSPAIDAAGRRRPPARRGPRTSRSMRFERRQPRHGEQVGAVAVAAVRPRRRRRIEHLGGDAAEPLEAPLDRSPTARRRRVTRRVSRYVSTR
ncbi:MAG: hypothetical protein MZV64_73485 [Ignavibacteriales bacterium]|nr:hypothetical protein [Ignavibacteriales bacterium]